MSSSPATVLRGLFLLWCVGVSRQNEFSVYYLPVYLGTAGWPHHITGLCLCLAQFVLSAQIRHDCLSTPVAPLLLSLLLTDGSVGEVTHMGKSVLCTLIRVCVCVCVWSSGGVYVCGGGTGPLKPDT